MGQVILVSNMEARFYKTATHFLLLTSRDLTSRYAFVQAGIPRNSLSSLYFYSADDLF